MGNGIPALTRDQVLQIIEQVDGVEAARKAALEFAVRDAVAANAARNAQTILQPAAQFVRSTPPPASDTAPIVSRSGRIIMQAPKELFEAARQAARTAASNPTVQRTAVGTGATATAAGGFMGTVGAVFAAPSLGAIGAMGGGAIAVAGGAVLLAGAVGVGIGVGIDHLVGAVRDDGRTLSDLLSGANQGVPVQDPTGRGTKGWRLIPDQK